MNTFLTFVAIGLGAGAAYAGIALGLVVTYRGTGTINFAAGAMAAWGAFSFDELRTEGRLWLPIPLNHESQLGEGGYGGLPLVVLTLFSVALLFALLYRAIVLRFARRRLANAVQVLTWAGAAAAVAWSAHVFVTLRGDGRYLLPLPPYRYDIGQTSFVVAFVVSVLLVGLLGLAAHLLVFQPLRSAPPLAKVVASVGLMTTLAALLTLRFGTVPRSVEPIFPAEQVSFGGVTVPRDRLYVAAVAVLLAVALWAYLKFTRLGLATRAASESERNAALGGWSPQVLAATTWVLASVVSTLLVILTLPFLPLSQTLYPLMVVPALACALVGRLTFVGTTVAAALGLGALQSVLGNWSTKDWWPDWGRTGLTDAVPFLVLIVVLFVLGKKLPDRAALAPDALPRIIVPRNRPAVIVPLVAGALAVLLLTDGSWRFSVITTLILTIATMSIVLLTGMTGQISLAQAGLAGTAGFALAKLSENGLGFPWAMIAAALIAAALGVVVGIPALRIRGARLAVVTLALAVAIERFLFRNPAIARSGGEPLPDVHVLGMDLGVRSGSNIARWQFGVLVLVITVLVGLAVSNVIRSPTGRRFIALRGNEKAAAAVGINVQANKLLAFGLSAFLAGVAGCLIGYSRNQLSADSFATFVNVSFVAFAYLGGITSMSGAMVGGLLAPLGLGYLLTDRLFDLGPNYSLVAGLALILTAIFNPVGIAGANRALFDQLIRRVRRHDGSTDEPERTTAASVPGTGTGTTRERPPLPLDRADRELCLETTALSVTYGGVRAVDSVSLEVRRGEIVGLIGPNGAGKTSFMDGVTGFTRAAGRIEFLGDDISRLPAHRRASSGLSRTWQSIELFGDLTVEQNVRLACEPASVTGFLLDVVHPVREIDQHDVDRALDVMGLAADRDAFPMNLSLGKQKLVGVARALSSRPRVLLVDEPAAGLDSQESLVLGERLCDIAADGTAILLIDHDMGLVLDTCDYIYVLEFGRVIARGTPEEVRRDDAVIHAYLGEAARAVTDEPQVVHQ